MAALYIVLIILAAVMLLLIIPADCVIKLSYNDNEKNGVIFIRYAFFKFKLLPAEEKAVKEEKAEEKAKSKKEKKTGDGNDVKSLIKLAKNVYTELKQDIFNIEGHFFRHTIRIKELNISSKFGVGDPMYTGILSGAANAIVYNAVSLIDRRMTLDKWNVSLDADFDNAYFSAGIYAKIRTRILFILKIGFMAAVLLIKINKINRRIKKNV